MSESRIKDSQKSRQDILDAAEQEFAEKGMAGARIDEIAAKARINKRMIYEYFGGKEELYKAVLAKSYSRLSEQETTLLSDHLSGKEAIREIIRLYFDFLKSTPSYVNLILWENLNKGQYIRDMDFSQIKDPTFALMRKVINEGKSSGVFREDLDSDQVILSILTYTFSYFSNRYTLSKLLGTDLNKAENIQRRLDNVTDMFLCYMCR